MLNRPRLIFSWVLIKCSHMADMEICLIKLKQVLLFILLSF